MKLQKLMYFTQAWYLRERGFPLLDDHFSRWQYGPVIPAIYHEFKAYEAGTITQPAQTLSADSDGWSAHVPAVPKSDRDTWALLRVIAQRYGGFSGPQLSAITHKAGGAWARGILCMSFPARRMRHHSRGNEARCCRLWG